MCANVCYSILACEYWQFNADEVYGGCYVQIDDSVPYPLRDSNLLLADPDWVEGEYIQHTCEPETWFGFEVPAWVHETWAQLSAGVFLCFCILCLVGTVRQCWNRGGGKRNRSLRSGEAESRGSKAELAEEARPMHRVVAAERYAELQALPEEALQPEEFPLMAGREGTNASFVSFASSSPLLAPMQATAGQLAFVRPMIQQVPAFMPMPLQQQPRTTGAYMAIPGAVTPPVVAGSAGSPIFHATPVSTPGSSVRVGPPVAPPGGGVASVIRRAVTPGPTPATPGPPMPRVVDTPEEWGTTLTIPPGI